MFSSYFQQNYVSILSKISTKIKDGGHRGDLGFLNLSQWQMQLIN